MIEAAFKKITGGEKYPSGSESRVYILPEAMSEPFGGPCVIKIYTEGATLPVYSMQEQAKHGVPASLDLIPLEDLANHELSIGKGLENIGLNVPKMHRTLTFGSPLEGNPHYIGGKCVPAVIMGQLGGMRDFEDLHENEHPSAIRNFIRDITYAMNNGYRPTDETCHDLNTVYDREGQVTFFDFSRWRKGNPLDKQDINDFFSTEGVLPKNVGDLDLII